MLFVCSLLRSYPAQRLCTAPRRHAMMTSRHLNVGGMTLSFQIRLTSEKEAGAGGGGAGAFYLRDMFHMFAFLLVQEWAANVIIMPHYLWTGGEKCMH